MKLKYLLAASVISLVAVGQSTAADLVKKAVPMFNFGGTYLGANIGLVNNKYKLLTETSNARLGLVGVFAGFGFDLYGFVASLEGGVDYAGLGSARIKGPTEDLRIRRRIGATVRARVGYAVDRFLPFAAVGVAYSHNRLRASTEQKKDLVGMTAGLGVDYAFSDFSFLRLEYRFNNLQKRRDRDQNLKFTGSEIRLGIAGKY